MLLPILCFLPMVCAAVCYAAGRRSKRLRDVLVSACGVCVFGLCLLLWGGDKSYTLPGFCGFGLSFRADGFRSLYATVAALMWMFTGLFAPEYFAHYHNRGRYSFFNLTTLGATLGVFLSDDLYTTFIFFEIMSLASYPWVAHEETPAAMKAAATYLAVAVIGGLTTLMGLFMLWHEVGTLSFAGLREALSPQTASTTVKVASWLVLFGFAAKAGMFPLHIWLPRAHPVAPAPASALLSGILTKSGVFGLMVICANIRRDSAAFGNALLVLAAVTMLLGAVLALMSVDLKRTLACSSMSQIGFIAVGLAMMVLLGEEGQLAGYGAVLHMVNHSLIKLCLFMCAGVVYMNLHKLNLNDIRGFGRKKPVLHVAFLLGALSIACVPPIGSGYNSKSLLHEAILEYIGHMQAQGGLWIPYKALELLFLLSGGLTVAYMTKLYICLFWEKNADPDRQAAFDAKKRSMNPLSGAVVLLSALVLPALGALPKLLMTPLAERSMSFLGQEALAHEIHYFSAENLIGAAESIAIGLAVYFLVVRRLLMRGEKGARAYVNLWPARLDLEERIYRPLLLKVLPGVTGAVTAWIEHIPESRLVQVVIPQTVTAVTRFLCEAPEYLAMLVRGTALRKKTGARDIPVGTRLTYACGQAMNTVAHALNATVCRRHPVRTDFEYVLDASRRMIISGTSRVTRSVSFGLLLLGLGLLITCAYLLLK